MSKVSIIAKLLSCESDATEPVGLLQAVTNWPPEHEGEKAITSKWWATVKRGTLFLAQQPATSNKSFVPMVTITVSSCQVDVPTEGLRGKTKCVLGLQPVPCLDV